VKRPTYDFIGRIGWDCIDPFSPCLDKMFNDEYSLDKRDKWEAPWIDT